MNGYWAIVSITAINGGVTAYGIYVNRRKVTSTRIIEQPGGGGES